MLHSQASINIEPRHEIGLAGLRVLQTLGNESCAPLGQQQELLDMLPMGYVQNVRSHQCPKHAIYFLLKPLQHQVSPLSQDHCLLHTDTFSFDTFAPPLPLKDFVLWFKGDIKSSSFSVSHYLILGLSFTLTRKSYYPSCL